MLRQPTRPRLTACRCASCWPLAADGCGARGVKPLSCVHPFYNSRTSRFSSSKCKLCRRFLPAATGRRYTFVGDASWRIIRHRWNERLDQPLFPWMPHVCRVNNEPSPSHRFLPQGTRHSRHGWWVDLDDGLGSKAERIALLGHASRKRKQSGQLVAECQHTPLATQH